MRILLNGTPKEIPEGIKLSALIERLDLSNRRLAIEVNEELVPRSQFAEYLLSPEDRVEIIQAVGGG